MGSLTFGMGIFILVAAVTGKASDKIDLLIILFIGLCILDDFVRIITSKKS